MNTNTAKDFLTYILNRISRRNTKIERPIGYLLERGFRKRGLAVLKQILSSELHSGKYTLNFNIRDYNVKITKYIMHKNLKAIDYIATRVAGIADQAIVCTINKMTQLGFSIPDRMTIIDFYDTTMGKETIRLYYSYERASGQAFVELKLYHTRYQKLNLGNAEDRVLSEKITLLNAHEVTHLIENNISNTVFTSEGLAVAMEIFALKSVYGSKEALKFFLTDAMKDPVSVFNKVLDKLTPSEFIYKEFKTGPDHSLIGENSYFGFYVLPGLFFYNLIERMEDKSKFTDILRLISKRDALVSNGGILEDRPDLVSTMLEYNDDYLDKILIHAGIIDTATFWKDFNDFAYRAVIDASVGQDSKH